MQYIIQLPNNKNIHPSTYSVNKMNIISNYDIKQGNTVNDPNSTNLSGSPNTNFLENLKKRINEYYSFSDKVDK
jgi:hypothetical protein